MICLKKLLEKMLTCVFESEVLYSGNKKTGTFSLDGNPSDYNIIIVKSMTNVEYFADICIISPYLTGNIKFDHEDGTGAYHSSLTIALGNNAMNATVNYNNVNWQLGVVQVIGIKILGGGYFLALFSAIERWWSHADCKEAARQNHDVVRCAIQINRNIIAKYINSGKRHLYEYGGRCFGRDTKWLQNGRSLAKSKWREYMLLLSVWQDERNNCGNTDKEHLVSRYDNANVRDSVSEGCLTLTRGCFAC